MEALSSGQSGWPPLESIASRLSRDEAQTRQGIMNGIIAKGGPVCIFDLKQDHALLEIDVERAILRLLAKKVIVENQQGQITFSYPVSALPTSHKVSLADGRSFHAMCAVDALGAAFTFNQNLTVASKCGHCGKPVHLAIQAEEIVDLQPAGTHVLHVDLNRYDNWSGTC